MGKDLKDRIIIEAVHELEKNGPGFRMDDLAHRMKISKRTLYENFSSKEEIIDKVVATMQDDLYEQHKQLLRDDRLTAEEKIVAFFSARVRNVRVFPSKMEKEFVQRMPGLVDHWKERSLRDWKLLEQFVSEAQASEEFIDFDKELFMYILVGASREIFNNIEKMQAYYAFPEAMEACVRTLLYGIKKNGGKSTNDQA